MSDRPSDHRARQIWQPQSNRRPEPELDRRADATPSSEAAPEGSPTAQRTADVRVLTPSQETEVAALSAHLATIAERALADPLEAEQLAADVWRQQPALVVAATRSAMPSQRDAARAELERLIRRAALDALPPVIAGPPVINKPTSEPTGRHRDAGPATSKKIGKPATGGGAGRAAAAAAAAPSPSPSPPPPAAAEPVVPAPRLATTQPFAPAPPPAAGELQRRPASRASGLADYPSTDAAPLADRPRGPVAAPRGNATASVAQPARRGRKLALFALASTVLMGGLGYGYFAYAPEAPFGLERADAPTQTPESPQPAAAAPPTPPEAPETAALATESLQLEAAEPAAGPLRERVELAAPPETPAAAAPPVVTLGDDLRLVLIHQSNSAAAADALEAGLASLKDPLQIELRSVDFSIATPRIRYFYADDAASAAALADILGPPANGAGSWQVQNFTHFRPGPTQGTVEIFVPNTGS